MSPPVALTKRWKKIKKRCSFSSSDRLVRSKSFTEQDVAGERGATHSGTEGMGAEKYLTVGSRDRDRFQGIRDKIAQWNMELKKRRSTENLASLHISEPGPQHDSMFVVASPGTGGGHRVKSAVVISNTNNYSSASLKTPRGVSRVTRRASPLSSPPSPSSDEYSDQRNDSYTSQHSLYQDQDSGYDGFCPEKSIYSTGSSDTSSVMSGSEAGQEAPGVSVSHARDLEIYARTRPRPRPAPIYEKHGHHGVGCGQYGPLAPRGRATIAQATVVNLVKTPPPPPEEPPPLPPRPLSLRDTDNTASELPPQLPPQPPPTKPRSRMIMSGAISLPRRRDQFKEAARRRGSYSDSFKENLSADRREECTSELYIEPEEKVRP